MTTNLIPDSIKETQETLWQQLRNPRLSFRSLSCGNNSLLLAYLPYLIDMVTLQQVLLPFLERLPDEKITPDALVGSLPVARVRKTTDYRQVTDYLVRGWIYLQIEGVDSGLLLFVANIPSRSLGEAQVEVQIFGPQVSFTEALETNLGILQSYLPTDMLSNVSITIGRRSRTNVEVCYMEELADPENVQTVVQRVRELDVDGLIDSGKLVQLIDDNTFSIFPQLIMTERPDYVSEALLEGKVIVFVEGSPFAIMGPSTFVDFFKSNEDLYIRWQMASFIRLLRFLALFVSLFFTAIYVAALTFHYEMIPSALLVSLVKSRSKVPFPPLFEALLLEMIIEFLREAGARLPFKVGQTMGIVGGIVIGQAAVAAGFTSNILIMIVALSALASFTFPSYMMSTAVRILRFPIILLAGIWGGFGIMLGASFLLIHILRQSSLGRPFFLPFFPFRLRDFKNSLIRVPFYNLGKRPALTRSPDNARLPDEAGKKRPIQ
ncbi:spore germination protein [Brevibacillus formosus]|uniref:Spore germination protein n=1 Tax=Brevibacillus formosus TaxID=54913 RepID=A0A837KJ13_9BACL|nr:spore germination protein [Brevibacillus formosus]KLH97730.1 spore gernimation protein [Brevibacillus formosus]MED1957468.1 spore germination protein [Brevibacillus formosus]PSJ98857.1 spore germination protein [Brevibacillus formosus]GED57581.1 spore germination protein [Brevibacillus formosus]